MHALWVKPLLGAPNPDILRKNVNHSRRKARIKALLYSIGALQCIYSRW